MQSQPTVRVLEHCEYGHSIAGVEALATLLAPAEVVEHSIIKNSIDQLLPRSAKSNAVRHAASCLASKDCKVQHGCETLEKVQLLCYGSRQ